MATETEQAFQQCISRIWQLSGERNDLLKKWMTVQKVCGGELPQELWALRHAAGFAKLQESINAGLMENSSLIREGVAAIGALIAEVEGDDDGE